MSFVTDQTLFGLQGDIAFPDQGLTIGSYVRWYNEQTMLTEITQVHLICK